MLDTSTLPKVIRDKYQIEKTISHSQFGTVYLARQVALDRKVIIKVLSPILGQDDKQRKRFQREAKILAELDDPGVTRIYDFGEEGKLCFIIQEFVPGETLEEVLARRKTLPLPEVLRIGKEVAEILSRIHKKGILHRDIKPSNIIIKEDGQIKLTDFGLAQSFRVERLTLDGEIIGTPAYMSPEQISGKGIDFRSDIFSLGVVLYELLTGENPFVAESFTGVLHKVLYEEVSLANLPEGIRSILSRMLAKEAKERFSSAEELRRAIETQLNPQPEILTVRKFPITRSMVLFILLFLLSILSLHLFLTQRRKGREKGEMPLSAIRPEEKETIPTLRETINRNFSSARQIPLPGSRRKGPNHFSEVIDSGYLSISCTPWADVYLNGLHLGATPFAFPFKLPAGEAKIKFSHPQFGTYEKVLFVPPKETVRVFFDFKSILAGLKVFVSPWAKIYLNGQYKGETPTDIIYLPPGRYELKLLNPNFPPYVETLELKSGEILERSIRW